MRSEEELTGSAACSRGLVTWYAWPPLTWQRLAPVGVACSASMRAEGCVLVLTVPARIQGQHVMVKVAYCRPSRTLTWCSVILIRAIFAVENIRLIRPLPTTQSKNLLRTPLGLGVLEAAYGAYRVANAQMMRAIRAVSSERGRDPRTFAVYAFGGAGPVHATGVAAGLGMRTVIIPPVPGVFSAFGLLAGDVERHSTRSFSRLWNETALAELVAVVADTEREAIATQRVWAGLESAPAQPALELRRYLDLQYVGQGSSLSIPLPSGVLDASAVAVLAGAFEAEHERTNGHRLTGQPIRATAFRLSDAVPASVDVATISFAASTESSRLPSSGPSASRMAYWGPTYGAMDTPVYGLEALGSARDGPALVECYDTTVVVPPNSTIRRGETNSAVIELSEERKDETE